MILTIMVIKSLTLETRRTQSIIKPPAYYQGQIEKTNSNHSAHPLQEAKLSCHYKKCTGWVFLKGLYRTGHLSNPLTSFSLSCRGHLHRPVAGIKADG